MRLAATFFLSFASMAKGLNISIVSQDLPKSVVIRGEGEIVDPDKWTEFPTPPPSVTGAPTPYPTPMTAAPTPINYILLEPGDAGSCPDGTNDVDLEDCLDAGELVVDGRFHVPFYMNELDSDFTMPCGCYVREKNLGNSANQRKMIEYNNCVETTYYVNVGSGSCDDGSGEPHYPGYYGLTDSAAVCEEACTVLDGCIGYDWSSTGNCGLRFASVTSRDSTTSLAGLHNTYDGCGNNCNLAVFQGDYGSVADACMKKMYGIPSGSQATGTQLICKLNEGIDAGVEDLDQWSKVYGYGTEAGGADRSLWAPDTLSGEFYIMRKCPDCIDSHKTIVYKRLTPLPAGYNVESLFVNTWSSTNNVLNLDFKLYSSMSYALADLLPWTYCNYNDNNVGFPRDCGPTGFEPYQWINLVSGYGQQNWAFYVWGGSAETATTEAAACVGSSPSECGCAVVNQIDYRGTVATTKSGHTCQAWDSQYPHTHSNSPTDKPNAGLESNYCRNPDNWHEGAWCYTTDPNVRWAICDIPQCFVPPYSQAWYKEYPYQPWHLPPWNIALNINPSDGKSSGWGSEIWYGEEDVGLDIQALSHDYKDYTNNWQRNFDCLAIARHDAKVIDGVKVWKMNEVKTLAEHFNSQTHNARAVVTSGGPVQKLTLEDAVDIDIDPILASDGPNNNLAFNWRYANNGVRVVLTDVGHPDGTLSCETCNDDGSHGLGNEFSAQTELGAESSSWYHDASILQDCFGDTCKAQGTDHGYALQSTAKLGNYAFYITLSNPDGSCPDFQMNNGDGNSLYNN